MREMCEEMEALPAEGRRHPRWSFGGMFVLLTAAGPHWMVILGRILK